MNDIFFWILLKIYKDFKIVINCFFCYLIGGFFLNVTLYREFEGLVVFGLYI